MIEGDGQARWRVVYGEVCLLPVGQRLTYERLRELLPGVTDGVLRGAVRRAVVHLQDVDHRTLFAVRGVGYEVAAPLKHFQLAEVFAGRARRSLGSAVSVIAAADRAAMSVDERRRADVLEHHLRATREMADRVSRRGMDAGVLPVVVGLTVDVARLRERGLMRGVGGEAGEVG